MSEVRVDAPRIACPRRSTGRGRRAAEIRYLSGETNRTLARLPITLTETTATMETVPTAVAGSVI